MTNLEKIYMNMMDKGLQYEYLLEFADRDDLWHKMYDYRHKIGGIFSNIDADTAYVTGECKFDWLTDEYESLVVDGNRAYLKLDDQVAVDRIANSFVCDQDSGLWLIIVDNNAAIDLATGTMGEYINRKYTPKYVLTNKDYGLLAEIVENKMYGKADSAVPVIRVCNGIISPLSAKMAQLIKSERQEKAENDGKTVEVKIPSLFWDITKNVEVNYHLNLNRWSEMNDKEKAESAIYAVPLKELSKDSQVSAETIRGYKKSEELEKLNGAAWDKVHRIALAYDRLR